MLDLNTVTIARLLDSSAFRAAAELQGKHHGREASRAAEALGNFIATNPAVLALLVANDPTPARSLEQLASVATDAGRLFRCAEQDVRAERERFKERHREVLGLAGTLMWQANEELARVRGRLAGIEAERCAARKRLEDAGLTAEQIATLEVSPTQGEIDQLHQQEHQLNARFQALHRFMGDPRREVLGGVELPGFPVGRLPHEQDAAELANHQRALL